MSQPGLREVSVDQGPRAQYHLQSLGRRFPRGRCRREYYSSARVHALLGLRVRDEGG